MDTLVFQDAIADGRPVELPDPQGGPLIVARRVSFRSGTVLPSHRHIRGQFLFASSGTMFVRSPGHAWLVPPSRALWIPPGAEHAIDMHGEVKMRTLYLHDACARALPSVCAVFEVTPLLRELIVRMTSPAIAEDNETAVPLAQLTAVELGRLAACSLELPMPASPDLLTVCEAILRDAVNASTATLNVSARTLSRRFLAETGITFVQWRKQAGLLHAIRLLASGAAVTTVALDLGYESPSAFSTMFKRSLGVTPRTFLPPRIAIEE